MKNDLENDLEIRGVGPLWESGDPEIDHLGHSRFTALFLDVLDENRQVFELYLGHLLEF